eukprot:86731-Amphidinium_carterae.1
MDVIDSLKTLYFSLTRKTLCDVSDRAQLCEKLARGVSDRTFATKLAAVKGHEWGNPDLPLTPLGEAVSKGVPDFAAFNKTLRSLTALTQSANPAKLLDDTPERFSNIIDSTAVLSLLQTKITMATKVDPLRESGRKKPRGRMG